MERSLVGYRPWGHEKLDMIKPLTHTHPPPNSHPTKWKKLTICSPQAHSPQTGWNWKADVAESQLPHLQRIERMSIN